MTRLADHLLAVERAIAELEQALDRAEAARARSDALNELAEPLTPDLPRKSLLPERSRLFYAPHTH